ncbi:GrpB family protein, partial [Xanthovirga aplysinae]|uniref:GrpB family protein n=1 Tax=Xanthovirga aplysinae TaxID=2529853 RepID=UPI0012BD0839
EKNELGRILGKYALKIEHFGSTAIPNILAKPTIDILVEIPNDNEIKDEIIHKMKSQNYYFVLRNDRHPPYIMFIKGILTKEVKAPTYHIHMGEKEHGNLWDRLYFRDYLKDNPKLAQEYENLKKELAKKYKNDRDAYTEGKTEFVLKITKEAKKRYS